MLIFSLAAGQGGGFQPGSSWPGRGRGEQGCKRGLPARRARLWSLEDGAAEGPGERPHRARQRLSYTIDKAWAARTPSSAPDDALSSPVRVLLVTRGGGSPLPAAPRLHPAL